MVVNKRIKIQTKGDGDVLDITSQVTREVTQSAVKDGIATIFVMGSTAAVTTIEFEPGLVADLQSASERIAPRDIPYNHNLRWGDNNGHSHLRASLLGASLVVPVVGNSLTLGTWQQIVVVDFDIRPRSREVLLQIMGE